MENMHPGQNSVQEQYAEVSCLYAVLYFDGRVQASMQGDNGAGASPQREKRRRSSASDGAAEHPDASPSKREHLEAQPVAAWPQADGAGHHGGAQQQHRSSDSPRGAADEPEACREEGSDEDQPRARPPGSTSDVAASQPSSGVGGASCLQQDAQALLARRRAAAFSRSLEEAEAEAHEALSSEPGRSGRDSDTSDSDGPPGPSTGELQQFAATSEPDDDDDSDLNEDDLEMFRQRALRRGVRRARIGVRNPNVGVAGDDEDDPELNHCLWGHKREEPSQTWLHPGADCVAQVFRGALILLLLQPAVPSSAFLLAWHTSIASG
jgi:hypothetical protein